MEITTTMMMKGKEWGIFQGEEMKGTIQKKGNKFFSDLTGSEEFSKISELTDHLKTKLIPLENDNLRPSDLSGILHMTSKSVRHLLRKLFPSHEKNTDWNITPQMMEKIQGHLDSKLKKD